MFLYKVDRDGNFKWAKMFGDKYYDEGLSVCVGPNNGYFVLGNTSPYFQNLYQHIGRGDAWLFLTDSIGNQLAQNIHGSTREEQAKAVLPMGSGVMSVGRTCGLKFTIGTGTNYLFGDYYTDTLACHVNGYFSSFQTWPLEVTLPKSKGVLKVYPNPAHNTIQIQLPFSARNARLVCITSDGRQLYKSDIKDGEREIKVDTSTWPPGIYAMSVSYGSGESMSAKVRIE